MVKKEKTKLKLNKIYYNLHLIRKPFPQVLQPKKRKLCLNGIFAPDQSPDFDFLRGVLRRTEKSIWHLLSMRNPRISNLLFSVSPVGRSISGKREKEYPWKIRSGRKLRSGFAFYFLSPPTDISKPQTTQFGADLSLLKILSPRLFLMPGEVKIMSGGGERELFGKNLNSLIGS